MEQEFYSPNGCVYTTIQIRNSSKTTKQFLDDSFWRHSLQLVNRGHFSFCGSWFNHTVHTASVEIHTTVLHIQMGDNSSDVKRVVFDRIVNLELYLTLLLAHKAFNFYHSVNLA